MLLSNHELIHHLAPVFKEINPIVILLSAIPLMWVLLSKIQKVRELKQKSDVIFEILKVTFLVFIIVQWTVVFGFFFKAGDALEALIYNKVNLEKLYPNFVLSEDETLGKNLKELVNRYKIIGGLEYTSDHYLELIKGRGSRIDHFEKMIEKEKKKIQRRQTGGLSFSAVITGLTGKPYSSSELNKKSEQLIKNWEYKVAIFKEDAARFEKLSKTAPLHNKKEYTLLEAMSRPFESGLISLVVLVTEVSQGIIFGIRNSLCMIFYLIGPFLISYSYFAILGDVNDEGGLNKRSKSFLNWLVILAFFPAIYAFLDTVILLILYIYSDMHQLHTFNQITSFFIFYSVLTITFPFLIHSLNPVGVLSGAFSAVSSLMMSGMIMSGARNGAIIPKSESVLKKVIKSNLDLIIKRKGF